MRARKKEGSGLEKLSGVAKLLRPAIIPAVRLLALAATGVGGYLAWVSFGGVMLVGCGSTPDCLQILRSRWAYWIGLPVSVPGVAVYGVLFAGTFWIHGSASDHTKQKAWSLML